MNKQAKIIFIGAGGRANLYAGFCAQFGADVVSVAEPNKAKRDKFSALYNIDEKHQFDSWEEVFEKTKFADAVIVATADDLHYEPTMAALEAGYKVLVEKPMSPSLSECESMVKKSEETGNMLMVCHVLRYSPFFEKIKELLDNDVIGKVVNFQLTENVVFWHYSHAYVRGIYRNEESSSPWILAKSCHDLDIITYLTGKKCLSVMSEGNLMHFTKEGAPGNTPDYCLDGCDFEKTCPYFAPKIYLEKIDEDFFPGRVLSTDTSYKARYDALKKGMYGRCVYKCDNNVTDHQSAIFEMEGGMTATFNMVGLSSENTRTLRVFGTKGDIRGHLDKGEIEVNDFLTGKSSPIEVDKSTVMLGHGGGDKRLLEDFLKAVQNDGATQKTSAKLSLQSHIMAFSAEQSRKEGRKILL